MLYNLRASRRYNNDFNQLNILHKFHLLKKSPLSIHNLDSKSKKKKVILLEKTSPKMQFPVYVKFLKKNKNDYSQSPERSNYTYSNIGGIKNISFANLSNKNRNSSISEVSPSKIRMSNIPIENNYTNYKNESEVKKLKKYLETPSQDIDVENNDLRNNRFITISPSQSSKKENSKKSKNIEIYKTKEIEIKVNDDKEYNFNDSLNKKHKMRYLLSKNYCGKKPVKRKFMTKSPGSVISEIKRVNTNNTLKSLNSVNKLNYPNKRNNLILDINNNNIKFKTKLEEKKIKDNSNLFDIPGSRERQTDNKKFHRNIKNEIMTKLINKKQTSVDNINNSYEPQNYNNNIIQEEILLNKNNIFIKDEEDNNNFNSNEIEIKLDDLIFIEGRLNDIMVALNNKKNIFDINAINETTEFFTFYFHSTLKDKFSLFFNSQNKIIIQSAFNLNLFTILMTYHLSINASMLIKVLIILKNIYELLKVNLYLFIRKIEIYYGDDYCQKNDIYFKTFNYFLEENNLYYLNEKEIIQIINKNCIRIVNDLENILNYYKTINNKYYSEFQEIYLNISKVTEQEICNFFYNNLYNISDESENELIQPKLNIFLNDENYIENNNENDNILVQNQENEEYLSSIILSYKKNKKIPPFIKIKNKKKYTIILDLEDTLINIKIDDEGNLLCNPRPGLIPFLKGIKPFYEIISFTKLSKEYSERIIEEIQGTKELFDYNFYREHCFLSGTKFIKDISRIGRDLKKIIVVDDLPENLKSHSENGILICPYNREDEDDRVLYELKKLLILFFILGYEDLRTAIKNYKDEIYNKITLGKVE